MHKLQAVIIAVIVALLGQSVAADEICFSDTAGEKPSLAWSIDFSSVLNNREGGDEMRPDQTFLFTRLEPQIGIRFGQHSLMGGAAWYQPLVNELSGYKVVPLLYYRFSGINAEFKAGFLPADESLPLYQRSDSINYVQPVVRGAKARYFTDHHNVQAWIDWRQVQSRNRREAFATGLQYEYHYKAIKPNVLIEYDHLAKTSASLPDEGVVDHVLIVPRFYFNVGNFKAGIGTLITVDRDRLYDKKWLARGGVIADASWQWRWLGVKETIYAGKEQMPLYCRYGSQLYWGDTWYHNKFYSRTDLVATIFKKSFVNVEARLTFHASDKKTAFWQQLSARFYFDDKMWKDSGNSTRPALEPRF